MVLYEMGLLMNGMVIFEKKFYTLKSLKKISDGTKGQFIDAIFNMTKVSMKEKIHVLKFKKYRIVFQEVERPTSIENVTNIFLVYTIGDKRLNTIFSSKLLEKVLGLYLEFHEKTDKKTKNYAIKVDNGSEFDKKVDKIIGDFFATSIDRMMNLFF